MISRKNNQKGFTLIELLLAMTGVSVLLIAIATTTIYLMNMYHKGITITTVNSAGRDVGDLIRRDGFAARGDNIKYISPSDARSGGLGRLCFGSYTYIWNTPSNLRARNGVKYSGSGTEIVFARVSDSNENLCTAQTNGAYSTYVSSSQSSDLLGDSSQTLAVHNVSVDKLFTDDSGRQGYTISYTLGTYEEGTISDSGETCRAIDETTNNFTFCAINQFKETVVTEKAL